MVFDSSVRFHYTGADSVDLSTLHWRVSKDPLCGPSSTRNHTITLQPLTCHRQIWPRMASDHWVTERKQRKESRAEVKRDTGHVPLGLDAILQDPGVAFPLIQSQEVHIAAAGFDHSSVDSCSADTGALDTRRQKHILLVDIHASIHK